MIQNVVVFIVNGDGSFFKQPPNTKFTANSVNKNSIFVIAPFVNTASIIANFKVAHKAQQVSRVATLTTMKPREITNESYVFDWNVWEVKVPQPTLQFLSSNRGSEILVSFNVGETTPSVVIPKFNELLGEITDTDFTLPSIIEDDGKYIVKVASYEYENGKYAFFNDTIIADKDNQKYIVYRAKYSAGLTPSVAFKVDPSIPMENFDEYEPSVVEQLIIQANENSGDIVNLENEVIRVEQELDTHILDADNPHAVTAEQVDTYNKTTIDNKDANTLQEAKDYTYSKVEIDNKDANTLQEAKNYTDSNVNTHNENPLAHDDIRQLINNLDETKLSKSLTSLVAETELSFNDVFVIDKGSGARKITLSILAGYLATGAVELFTIVEELPTENQNPNTIYLLATENEDGDNQLLEYIWIGNESRWELIGSLEVDLSDYYTKEEANVLFNGKVDKVSGKGLSTNDYTNVDKNKVDLIETNGDGSKYFGDDGTYHDIQSQSVTSVNGQTGAVVLDADDIGALPDDTPIPTKLSDLDNDEGFVKESELETTLLDYVEKEVGKGLSTNDYTNTDKNKVDNIDQIYTSAEKTKLSGIEAGAQVNPTASQIKTQYESNANTNAFTDGEKSKLASLESSKFVGQYISLTQLQSAHPTASVGSYGFVDPGSGSDVVKYIWDSSDTKWVLSGEVNQEITAAQVKSLYEDNADTNAFTDAEKSKLSGIEAGAQVNPSASAIKTQYESNANTNAFTDAEKSKLAGIEAGAEVNEVNSVNGKVGTVVINADDVGALPDDTPLFSGDYGDLSNKPTIDQLLGNLSTLGFVKRTGTNTYVIDTSNYQPLDADLSSIAGLSGTSGLLRKTASNTWQLDTSVYLTAITKAQVEAVLTGTITTHTHNASAIVEDASHRFVTDTEKNTWNAKQNALGFTPENVANKKTTLSDSDVEYPTSKAVKTAIETAVSQTLKPMGNWNANTNTPTLTDSDINRANEMYYVSVAGTQFGIEFDVGDELVYNTNGVIFRRDNVDAVVSVNTKKGVVVLNQDDIGDGATYKQVSQAEKNTWNNKVDKITGKGLSTEDYTSAEKSKLSGIEAGAQVNTVTTVAGRTGAVVLAKADVGLGSVQNYAVASKTQAEAGTSNSLYMTPLRTKELITVVMGDIESLLEEI